MANNPALYNAIVSGIIGGNQQRFLAPTVGQADFTIFRTVAGVMADAIDERIQPLAEMSSSIVALMQSICQGIFQNQSVDAIRHNLPTIADNIVGLFEVGLAAFEEVPPDATGTTIPEGTYNGQPVYWNGTAYEPLPEGENLLFQQLGGELDEDSIASVQFDGTNSWVGVATGAELTRDPGLTNAIQLRAVANETDWAEILIKSDGLFIDYVDGALITRYHIGSGLHDFQINGTSILKMDYDTGSTTTRLGFFGVTPVTAQTVTGATETDVLESLITALVNFGLIIDGRP